MARDNELGISWGGGGWAIPCRELRGLYKNGGGGGGGLIVLLGWGPNTGWISRIMVVPIVPYPYSGRVGSREAHSGKWGGGGMKGQQENRNKVKISQKYR